jgi:hypothetical protein
MSTDQRKERVHRQAWRDGERQFLNELHRILRDYQEGTLKGNSTTIGQLDQPLTGVADAIQIELRQRVQAWRRNG